MTFRADLHCHSFCSDGTDSPEVLLEKAKEAGLSALSITDHDTLAAYTPQVFQKAQELGIELLVGAEVSSEWGMFSVHILAYGKGLLEPPFAQFLREMQKRRLERNLAILEKLKELGMDISMDELSSVKTQSIGRPHIASLMLGKGYVSSLQEAFDRYLKEGASCYPFGCKFSPEEVIGEIHQVNAKAVLAHPHFLAKTKEGILCKAHLLTLSFDGIESYYGNFSEETALPWVDACQERGWIATGGSDYHGTVRPNIRLGASWTKEEAFVRLQSVV